ncbi:MAG: hypothetical protein LC793_10320 [Thermomicrobia bacterium]|nr:hypothetical protein [Thermomicrobia bacterium]
MPMARRPGERDTGENDTGTLRLIVPVCHPGVQTCARQATAWFGMGWGEAA